MLPIRRAVSRKQDEKEKQKAVSSSSLSPSHGSSFLSKSNFITFILLGVSVLSLTLVWHTYTTFESEREIGKIQMDQLRGLVRQHTIERQNLQQSMIDTQNHLMELKAEAADKEEKEKLDQPLVIDLQKQIKQANSAVQELSKSVNQLRSMITRLEEEKRDVQEQLDQVAYQKKELERKLDQLKAQAPNIIPITNQATLVGKEKLETQSGPSINTLHAPVRPDRLTRREEEREKRIDEKKNTGNPNILEIVAKSTPPEKVIPKATYKPNAEHIQLPRFPDSDPTAEQHRQAIKEAFKFNWDNYKTFAWGFDELKPLSRTGEDWFGLGLTIVDSIDTLYIMGLMDEYQLARDWIAFELNFNTPTKMVSTFETTIRELGGLLSIYGLTKDRVFLDRAEDLGHRLLKAFSTPLGIPDAMVHLKTGMTDNLHWTGGASILSEIGSIQMEFLYLSYLTKNPVFAEKPMAVLKILRDNNPQDGIYPLLTMRMTGKFSRDPVIAGKKKIASKLTIGALADSFYEYQLKLWLLTNKQYDGYKTMYEESSNGIIKKLVRTSVYGLKYIDEISKEGKYMHQMEHLTCFAAGMFGLGSVESAVSNPEEQLDVAKEIMETCWMSYNSTKTGIGSEIFSLMTGKPLPDPDAAYYLLRPEVVESLFVMWRLTHDQKYRDWGWQIFQAIDTHCRTPTGFSGIRDVRRVPVTHDDLQQSFFLAETLKYLYLLFSPDDLLPLSDFVFNTEAHPFHVIPETSKTMPRNIHKHLMLS